MNREQAKKEIKEYKQSIPYGEWGVYDSDCEYIIDKIFDNFEKEIKTIDNKIFELKIQTNNYVLFVKHKGCDYRESEVDETFYKIRANLEDYVLIKKEHKELASTISYDSNIKFEWWHNKSGGYWQTGRDFFETYDDDLRYKIK